MAVFALQRLGRLFRRTPAAAPVPPPQAAPRRVPRLPAVACASRDALMAWRAANGETLHRQRMAETALIPQAEGPFELAGFCVVCDRPTTFAVRRAGVLPLTGDGRPIPNWREDLACAHCGLINRARAAAHVLLVRFGLRAGDRLYLTEQRSRLFKAMAGIHPDVVGSEFMGPAIASGTMVGDIRHEDLDGLSFGDAELAAIVSLDVLEHVPDPGRALAEMARVLRPGGGLVLTVPFDGERYEPLVRARRGEDGQPVHLLPPEYHGDPVRPKDGVLVYQIPGYGFLDLMRDHGFAEVRALYLWSEELGYLGDSQVVIVGRRI